MTLTTTNTPITHTWSDNGEQGFDLSAINNSYLLLFDTLTGVVTWIDKVAPYATNINYSPSSNTNGNVTVMLTISKVVQPIA